MIQKLGDWRGNSDHEIVYVQNIMFPTQSPLRKTSQVFAGSQMSINKSNGRLKND